MYKQQEINLYPAPNSEEEFYDNLIGNLLSIEEKYNTYWKPFYDLEYSNYTTERTDNTNYCLDDKELQTVVLEITNNHGIEDKVSSKLTTECSTYFVCGLEYKNPPLNKKSKKKALKKKIDPKRNLLCSFCNSSCQCYL